MDFKQLINPIDINQFWLWLFENQHQVGKIIDYKKITENGLELNKKYRGQKIKINKKTRWIEELVPLAEGVNIKIRDENGNVAILANVSQKAIVYGYDVLELVV